MNTRYTVLAMTALMVMAACTREPSGAHVDVDLPKGTEHRPTNTPVYILWNDEEFTVIANGTTTIRAQGIPVGQSFEITWDENGKEHVCRFTAPREMICPKPAEKER